MLVLEINPDPRTDKLIAGLQSLAVSTMILVLLFWATGRSFLWTLFAALIFIFIMVIVNY